LPPANVAGDIENVRPPEPDAVCQTAYVPLALLQPLEHEV
jgi:hypothetical protein